jgi:hypothetical protein
MNNLLFYPRNYLAENTGNIEYTKSELQDVLYGCLTFTAERIKEVLEDAPINSRGT